MADNTYETKLVISADTSDAEKKLKEVGKTKVDPVKVDVIADKVKIDTPKVDPVKVDVIADKVKIDTPKVEPVKVPVTAASVKIDTPKVDPVKVDVIADKVKIDTPKVEPVKVPVEQPAPVKIKTLFDSSGIGKLSNALHGVRELANRVMSALGLFGFAVGIVMSVVSAFKALKEHIEETRNAARKLQDEFAKSRIEERVKREASSYDALNKALAEANRLEKERNDILAGRKASERSIEDAKSDYEKQREISALDPNAADYKDKKAAIERKYADAESDRKAARAGEDVRGQAKDLYDRAKSKDKEADALQKEADRRDKTFQLARERSWATGMAARSGKEEDVKAHAEAEKVANDAYDAWKKVDDEIRKIRNEAQSMRNRAGEMAGGNRSANMRRDAEKMARENDERERKAKEKQDSDRTEKEKSDKEKLGRQKVEDARLERQKQEEILALNPNDKDYAFKRNEIERLYSAAAAEKKVARAENETDRQAAQEDLETTNLRNSIERRDEMTAAEKDKMSGLEAFAERAASVEGVSQNRLTAMGLGSGVTSSNNVASDVRRLVDLLKQNVEATKNIKVEQADPVGVYGE